MSSVSVMKGNCGKIDHRNVPSLQEDFFHFFKDKMFNVYFGILIIVFGQKQNLSCQIKSWIVAYGLNSFYHFEVKKNSFYFFVNVPPIFTPFDTLVMIVFFS